MRTNFFEQNLKFLLLIFIITSSGLTSLYAQSGEISLEIEMDDVTPNLAYFHLEGVEFEDLIYLRFSDGFHLSKVVTENDGILDVTLDRRFNPNESFTVAAYVAKKGGTLDLAVGNTSFAIGDCLGCLTPQMPQVDMAGDYINLTTSWNPFFTEGVSEIPALVDDVTGETSTTELPWFFVNLTLDIPEGSTEGNIFQLHYPSDIYHAVGAIIEDEWMPLGSFNWSSNPSLNSIISQDDLITFNLGTLEPGQTNFYLVLEGEPAAELEEYEFVGQLYSIKGKKGKKDPTLVDEYTMKISPTHQPHDPNQIYSPTSQTGSHCGDFVDGYVPFKVDFQNIGEEFANTVNVRILIEPEYFDVYSLTDIESSHPVAVGTITQDDRFYLHFTNIDLPGTNQVNPSAPYNETKGWVKFKLRPHCPNSFNGTYETTGEIIFNGPGGFEETTPLNVLERYPCGDDCGNLGRSSETEHDLDLDKFGIVDHNELAPFSVKAYPTLVNDDLILETSWLKPNVPLEINFVDISGIVWKSQLFLPQTKTIYQEEVDLADLPNGIYFIQIKHGDQLIHKKIVKH